MTIYRGFQLPKLVFFPLGFFLWSFAHQNLWRSFPIPSPLNRHSNPSKSFNKKTHKHMLDHSGLKNSLLVSLFFCFSSVFCVTSVNLGVVYIMYCMYIQYCKAFIAFYCSSRLTPLVPIIIFIINLHCLYKFSSNLYP